MSHSQLSNLYPQMSRIHRSTTQPHNGRRAVSIREPSSSQTWEEHSTLEGEMVFCALSSSTDCRLSSAATATIGSFRNWYVLLVLCIKFVTTFTFSPAATHQLIFHHEQMQTSEDQRGVSWEITWCAEAEKGKRQHIFISLNYFIEFIAAYVPALTKPSCFVLQISSWTNADIWRSKGSVVRNNEMRGSLNR